MPISCIFVLLFSIPVLIFSSGCAKSTTYTKDGDLETEGKKDIPLIATNVKSAVSPVLKQYLPLKVAVLPAQYSQEVAEKIAEWDDVDPVKLFRTVFFGRFSVLPFRDLHIREVDSILYNNLAEDSDSIKGLSAGELGEILQVDALIYINIDDVNNVTAGVYSGTSYKATVQMISSQDGDELWKADLLQSMKGGLVGKSSQLSDLIEFERLNKNRPLAFRKVAEIWSHRIIEDLKEKWENRS